MAISKRLRWQVLERDEFKCRYCGAAAPFVSLVMEHVTPRVKGGQDVLENLVAACEPCNNGKRADMPPEWLTQEVARAVGSFTPMPAGVSLNEVIEEKLRDDLADMTFEAEVHLDCLRELEAIPAGEAMSWIAQAYAIAPQDATRDEILRCAGAMATQERRRQEAGNGPS